jgi:hypothetical protein
LERVSTARTRSKAIISRNEDADARAHRHDERLGHKAGQKLPQTEQREKNEDPAFEEHRRQGFTVRGSAAAMKSDYRVCELSDIPSERFETARRVTHVRVDTEPRGKSDRQVGEDTHQN